MVLVQSFFYFTFLDPFISVVLYFPLSFVKVEFEGKKDIGEERFITKINKREKSKSQN